MWSTPTPSFAHLVFAPLLILPENKQVLDLSPNHICSYMREYRLKALVLWRMGINVAMLADTSTNTMLYTLCLNSEPFPVAAQAVTSLYQRINSQRRLLEVRAEGAGSKASSSSEMSSSLTSCTFFVAPLG